MAYTRVNWQDYPNTSTPITATNLNKMDLGIANLDTAVSDIPNQYVSRETFVDTVPPYETITDQTTGTQWKLQQIGSFVIMSGRRTVSNLSITTAWGSMYSSGNASITPVNYPYTFSAVPTVVVQTENIGTGIDAWISCSVTPGTTTATPAYEVLRPNSVETGSIVINYLVVGILAQQS